VIPESARKIWEQLGMQPPLELVRIQEVAWGQLEEGQRIGRVYAIFPRLDVKKTVDELRRLEHEEAARQAALLGKAPAPAAAPEPAKISIDDFAKVEMRVAQVLSAERVKGKDKLLHLKVDAGEGQPRTLVAGIAEAYAPEQLVGRKVVIVANLQPRKVGGIESNGMIVAASVEGGKPVLAAFLEEIPIGARLK
jgi:methionyl-tRNA synthetase